MKARRQKRFGLKAKTPSRKDKTTLTVTGLLMEGLTRRTSVYRSIVRDDQLWKWTERSYHSARSNRYRKNEDGTHAVSKTSSCHTCGDLKSLDISQCRGRTTADSAA